MNISNSKTFLACLFMWLKEWLLDLVFFHVRKRLNIVIQTIEAFCKGAVHLCYVDTWRANASVHFYQSTANITRIANS